MRRFALAAVVLLSGSLAACAVQRGASGEARLPERVAAVAPPLTQVATERHVGDFSVHEISGSFRKQPALLSERVLARQGTRWLLEYALEDESGRRALRVTIDDGGNVERVSVLVDGAEEPGTLDDYEGFMASASLVPDENTGFTASTRGTCSVGPAELECETKSFRVLLGEREATLGVTASRALPGLELGGEITAPDGTVLYRSVLLEHGNDAADKDGSVALGAH